MRLPLWGQVSLWLLLNLLLLAALTLGWFLLRTDARWSTLAAGPLGDRVQVLAEDLVNELRDLPPAVRGGALTRLGEDYGAEFHWLRLDGRRLAGPDRPLPSEVTAQLQRPLPAVRREPASSRRGAPGERAQDSPERATQRARLVAALSHRGGSRFLVQSAADPGAYWFGLRLRVLPEAVGDAPLRPPSVLLIRLPSAWALARLLGLGDWLAFAAVGLGVSVAFWLPFVHRITRTVRRLTTTTARLAEGRFDTRTGLSGHDELAQLAAGVDTMAARLDTLVHGQRRFLGDVAHELGSPLGRLQVATELLETRAPASLQPQIADVREEVQQLATLVGELLTFTRAGLRPRSTVLRPVPLAPLLERILAREAAAGRAHLAVPPAVAALADPALLERALANLIRNSVRHAGPSARLTLAAHRSADHLHLTVADDGPGVPPEAWARLGEPFYRPDLARTRESGGVGLGLAIVRSAIAACGGTVVFRPAEPHGFVAQITLAAAPG